MKILIAGASGGIGRYLADRLCLKHQVYGTFHTHQPESDRPYSLSKVNITREEDVSSWVQEVCCPEDDLALIYCVGANYNCVMHKSDAGKWREVIETNLIGVQHTLRHLLPKMRERHFGRIVLLSSVVPQMGVPGTSAYAASKSAMWGLGKAVAIENAKYGITINTINLGYFDIGMIQDVPVQTLESIIAQIPCGKLGNPSNIVSAVNFLIDSDYTTGSQINLNGGLR
ncbi:MAG: SDR family oxidoreductase [Methanosarcina sp.]|nr:SDR family oxidoreductase [Methanosarcina sp.]